MQDRQKLPSSFLLQFMVETGRLRSVARAEGKEADFPERCELHEHATKEEKKACPRNWRIQEAAAKAAKRALDEEEGIIKRPMKKQKPS